MSRSSGGLRYPFAALEELLRPENARATAESLGMSVRRVHRLRNRGLTPIEADELAVAAGLHPRSVWEWWGDHETNYEPERPHASDPAMA